MSGVFALACFSHAIKVEFRLSYVKTVHITDLHDYEPEFEQKLADKRLQKLHNMFHLYISL